MSSESAPVPSPPSEETPKPSPPSNSAPPRPSRPTPPSSDELKSIVDSINASIQQNRDNNTRPYEQKDERCWTRSSQTNRRRAQGLPPKVTSLCYINFKNELAEILVPSGPPPTLVPVPDRPGTFVVVPSSGSARELLVPPPLVPEPGQEIKPILARTPSSIADNGPVVPAYHWRWLDSRYFYYASGRSTVARHMEEMGGTNWKGLDAMIERCEKGDKQREENNNVLGRRGRREQRNVRLALGFPDEPDDYETMVNLSTVYSNSLRRFHTHLHRIYSPVFNNLARLPTTFTDGTQEQMLRTIGTRLTDGSALKLAERMYNSTCEVVKTLRERSSGGSSSGGSTGGGGSLGGLGGGGSNAL